MIRLVLLAAMALVAMPANADPLASVTPFRDPSRLVAIGGSVLEIVYALGEEGHLVARDMTGSYPPEAQKLADIGYMRTLSPEGVLSVNPTAILAIKGSGPPDALALIGKSGVDFDEIPESYSAVGVLDKVRAVGKALGVDAKSEALAKKLEAELNAVTTLTKAIPESSRKRVLFVLSVSSGKITAAGTDTAANGIIGLAGAVNAVDGYAGYKGLSDEAIVAARPDVVLVMENAGDGSATREQLLASPAIGLTPAGKAGAVIAMDGEYLLGFGPRTPAALRDLATQLYGDRLGGK